jgi:hypothetical protein
MTSSRGASNTLQLLSTLLLHERERELCHYPIARTRQRSSHGKSVEGMSPLALFAFKQ